MATRVVRVNLNRITGATWPAGATVRVLLKRETYTVEAVAATYPTDEVEATTDENGVASLTLWANAEAALPARYVCVLPTAERFEFDLPDGDEPADVEALRAAGQVPAATAAALVESLIAAALAPYALLAQLSAHASTKATADVLGHVRVGAGLLVDDGGVLSVGSLGEEFATVGELTAEATARAAADASLQAAINALTAAVAAQLATHTQTISADTAINIGAALRAVVLIETSGADVTATLPPVAGMAGRSIILKKTADPNLAVVDGDGSELIDGALVYNLQMENSFVEVAPVGAAWRVIGKG